MGVFDNKICHIILIHLYPSFEGTFFDLLKTEIFGRGRKFQYFTLMTIISMCLCYFQIQYVNPLGVNIRIPLYKAGDWWDMHTPCNYHIILALEMQVPTGLPYSIHIRYIKTNYFSLHKLNITAAITLFILK